MAKIPQYDITETIYTNIKNPEKTRINVANDLLHITSGSIPKKQKTNPKQTKRKEC